jgi:hypothetical protein
VTLRCRGAPNCHIQIWTWLNPYLVLQGTSH